MKFDKVMSMNKTITITSKGQTTIPAAIRRKLGLAQAGGVLQMSFNESRRELTITKPLGIDELSQHISSYIQPDTTPVTDVSDYYQRNRGA